MCRLRNIAKCDYQESVTTRQTDGQTPDKVIPMWRYASQATQKYMDVLSVWCFSVNWVFEELHSSRVALIVKVWLPVECVNSTGKYMDRHSNSRADTRQSNPYNVVNKWRQHKTFVIHLQFQSPYLHNFHHCSIQSRCRTLDFVAK